MYKHEQQIFPRDNPSPLVGHWDVFLIKILLMPMLPLTTGSERCSSVVEGPLIMHWVIGSIPHGGPIEANSHS